MDNQFSANTVVLLYILSGCLLSLPSPPPPVLSHLSSPPSATSAQSPTIKQVGRAVTLILSLILMTLSMVLAFSRCPLSG